jgi:hypothetical protein
MTDVPADILPKRLPNASPNGDRFESITAPPSHEALAEVQNSNDELRTLLAANTALRLEKQPIPGTTVSMYCDTVAGKHRPYIPTPLRLLLFQSFHDLSHPGTKATEKLVAQSFVLPGIQKDCRTSGVLMRMCQSQSYFTTDGQSVSMSWCRAPLWGP